MMEGALLATAPIFTMVSTFVLTLAILFGAMAGSKVGAQITHCRERERGEGIVR